MTTLQAPSIPWWSWTRTSAELHRYAEQRLLQQVVKVPYIMRKIPVELENKDVIEINTLQTDPIDESKPSIVLIHGLAAGLGTWAKNIDSLHKKYNVYAIDLPGCAGSSRFKLRASAPEKVEELLLSSLNQWRQAVGLNKFSLMGHSFGGFISGCYASTFPDQIQHLFLADAWGVDTRTPYPRFDAFRSTFKGRMLFGLAKSSAPLSILRLAGPWGKGMLSSRRPDIGEKWEDVLEDTELFYDYIHHCNAPHPTGEHMFVALSDDFLWAYKPLSSRLENWQPSHPVTCIYGARSWMRKELAKQFVDDLDRPEHRYYQVHDAGHHVIFENAKGFNQAVNHAVKSSS